MEILFIGVACTEDAIYDSDRRYYNNVKQVRPQQYFDLTLTKGLSKASNVTAISLPPVASYPKSTCLFYKRKADKVTDTLKVQYISLLNLPIIKTVIIMISIFLAVMIFGVKNKNREHSVLMGYISFDTSLPVLLASKLTGMKVFAMVPDVPLFMREYGSISNPIKRVMTRLMVKIDRHIENRFDGYVFLTEHMNTLINRDGKPYIVVEGMIDDEDIRENKEVEASHKQKVIMYAGTLHEKFGIKNLIEAFYLSNLPGYELWIFGDGDYVGQIKIHAERNENIIYKGTAARSEILKFERAAMLLVNPRPSSEEFTKYSFPSKTLEYMASGTPLLTTMLPGIPDEYFNYVFYFKSENVEDMAVELERVALEEELTRIGKCAREFVMANKNNVVQGKKIYKFISENIM